MLVSRRAAHYAEHFRTRAKPSVNYVKIGQTSSKRSNVKVMSAVKKDNQAVVNHPRKTIGGGLLRHLLISLGFVCIALGVLGIFLPLLPTVPFLLLAAACFARGSDRCYSWLIEHRHLGPMVQGYMDGKGIPVRAKWTALCLIWLTIPITAVFAITYTWSRALLLLVGLAVSIYLVRLPLRQEEE